MTVKELKEALVNIPDNYKVVADDGMGMENGSPVDAIVIMDYYNKICMATGFETEDTIIKKNEELIKGISSNSLPKSKKKDDLDTVIKDPWNYEGLPEVGI